MKEMHVYKTTNKRVEITITYNSTTPRLHVLKTKERKDEA